MRLVTIIKSASRSPMIVIVFADIFLVLCLARNAVANQCPEGKVVSKDLLRNCHFGNGNLGLFFEWFTT